MTTGSFIPPHPLNTAVLFLVFNRLDTTKKVFAAIKKAKPPRLYIAADGARTLKAGEAEKVNAVRDFILQNIDWDCDVKTLFREENLGCKYAVSGAINWFFEQEEMGVILEDDCLPSQSFFWFCEELLERYKDDMRVWNIGGYRPDGLKGDDFSYTFSKFTHIWGWATWADRWRHYDVALSMYYENNNLLKDYEFFSKDYENISRINILNKVQSCEIDTWDYQWNFTVRINNGLSIRPNTNLVGNVGFGEDATHTMLENKEIEGNVANNILFPLKHSPFMMVHKKDDGLFSEKNIDNRFFSKVKRKLL